MSVKIKKCKAVIIDRSLSDDNFAHTLGLLGPCAAWAEGIERGHKLDFNDLNMISLPVEIAVAFAKDSASREGPLQDAAQRALSLLSDFQKIFSGKQEIAK